MKRGVGARTRRALVTATAIAAALVALGGPACRDADRDGTPPVAAARTSEAVRRSMPVPWNGDGGADGGADASIPHGGGQVPYQGGPVISNVNVVVVFWGGNVDATIVAGIPGFYQFVVSSPYFAWLSDYSTTGLQGGTNQNIGPGSYAGSYTITPANKNLQLADGDIQNELAAQIGAGNLPAPVFDGAGYANSLYMIHFPANVSITTWFGASCVQFCAYHDTATINGKYIPYGVIPDQTAGCFWCGMSTDFRNTSAVASHELFEATTDPDVGIANQIAWYDLQLANTGGEIGDLCNVVDVDYSGYFVQSIWSDLNNQCIVVRPVCNGSDGPCRTCTAADDHWPPSGCTDYCATDANDVDYGRCVQCRDTSECGPRDVCDHSGTAANDTCRPCTVDADCPAGKVCETIRQPLAGGCYPCTPEESAGCSGDTPVCYPATDQCVGCLFDSDCTANKPFCQLPAHVCRPCYPSDCVSPAQCAQDTSDPHFGACVQCTADLQCPTGACDPATDRCVGCTSDAQCSGTSPVCGPDQTCHACTSDGDCASSSVAFVCAQDGPLAGACVQCTAAKTSACTGETPVCDLRHSRCVAAPADAGADASAAGGKSKGGCSTAARGGFDGDAGAIAALLLLLVARARRPPRRSRLPSRDPSRSAVKQALHGGDVPS